ncbi:Gfo/Idh/MocA family protein [Frigoribacterium sp. 2-23]|uniref:Gfo/Idh/MocA family protein n=1 Tax=Frigoribacterium sp. 2-23 TaxID=3415006 RepID=UPI003C6FDC97
MSIRWGILGAGGIAATFTADLVDAGIPVSAIGSRDADKAREFADRFGVQVAHGSYEALVHDDDVDAVYVATPHVFHADNALLAIEAGKHVLIEKPFTLNAVEAEQVFAAAAAADVMVLEAMWTRFLPQSERLRAVIRSGVIGEIRLVEANHLQNLPTDPRHRINDPALGGGALLDLGVYPVSLAHDLLSAPSSIDAFGVLSDQGVDKRVGALLGFESGAMASLYAALDVAGSNAAVVFGTGGRIELDPTWYGPGGFTVYDLDDTVVDRFEADEKGLRGMHHQARELERVVESGERVSPVLTPRMTLDVMRTMDEIRRIIGVTYPGEIGG